MDGELGGKAARLSIISFPHHPLPALQELLLAIAKFVNTDHMLTMVPDMLCVRPLRSWKEHCILYSPEHNAGQAQTSVEQLQDSAAARDALQFSTAEALQLNVNVTALDYIMVSCRQLLLLLPKTLRASLLSACTQLLALTAQTVCMLGLCTTGWHLVLCLQAPPPNIYSMKTMRFGLSEFFEQRNRQDWLQYLRAAGVSNIGVPCFPGSIPEGSRCCVWVCFSPFV